MEVASEDCNGVESWLIHHWKALDE